jgi:hypothetical protein
MARLIVKFTELQWNLLENRKSSIPSSRDWQDKVSTPENVHKFHIQESRRSRTVKEKVHNPLILQNRCMLVSRLMMPTDIFYRL